MNKKTASTIIVAIIALVIVFFNLQKQFFNFSYAETEINTVVVECTKGNFLSTPTYFFTTEKSKLNFGTAYTACNGYYEYNITVNIDGTNYVVMRTEEYAVGQKITVTKCTTTYEGIETITVR